MVYEPIVDNVMDYKSINEKSVGYSILGGKSHLRYGLFGIPGVHENGNLAFHSVIGGKVNRTKNEFLTTLFVNQYPTANSSGRLWEGGVTDPKEKFADWAKVGLKPIFEAMKEDMKVLLPECGKMTYDQVKATLIRSQDDIQSYAKGELMRKTLLNAFLSFPNITSDSFDCFFIPSFHNGPLKLQCNLDGLSQELPVAAQSTGTVGTNAAAVDTVGNIKINGRYEIDLEPQNPELERFIAAKRQNKAMWNFIEDLFGIDRRWAPLDFIYLKSQLDAVKDFGTFVFDQIMSFDQKPFVSGLDVSHYVTMQLLRQAAFNYIIQRCPVEYWFKNTKILVRHPGISNDEFEQSMAVVDKYWAQGSFERVTAAGEGFFDLNIFPVGSRKKKLFGFDHEVPCLTMSEVPTGLDAKDYKEAQETKSLPWMMCPRIFKVDDPPRVISWDRLFGYDGIIDGKPTAVQINVITPSNIKQIVPKLNVNSQSFDRFGRELWPILIQQYQTSTELEEKTFGKALNNDLSDDLTRYSCGLVTFIKGNLYGIEPSDVAASKKEVLVSYKDKDEIKNDKFDRYSLWR